MQSDRIRAGIWIGLPHRWTEFGTTHSLGQRRAGLQCPGCPACCRAFGAHCTGSAGTLGEIGICAIATPIPLGFHVDPRQLSDLVGRTFLMDEKDDGSHF
jgi:hypothetical protein